MNKRRTRSQEKILDILKSLGRSISAQDLHRELKDRQQPIGLATIYRSLDALKVEGTVQVRTLANGESVYSCLQTDTHHLTCLQCGASIELDECPVHELEERLNRSHHFKIFYHTLEFFGLCTQCQESQAL